MEYGNFGFELFKWFIWVCIMILSIFFTVYISILLANRFNNSPLQTVIESIDYPLGNILFPAITICFSNRVDWSKIDEAAEIFIPNGTKEVKDLFQGFTSKLESFEFGNFLPFREFENVSLEPLDSINISELMEFMSYPCEDHFSDCRILYWYAKCCRDLIPQKSEFGFCHSFNTNGLNGSIYDLPLRSSLAGWEYGIDLTAIPGSPESRVPGSINPNGVKDEATDSKYLKLPGFEYSRSNCLSACRQNYLVDRCNCTLEAFFPIGNYTPCKASDFKCLVKNNHFFNLETFKIDGDTANKNQSGMVCFCPPDCESLVYQAETPEWPYSERMKQERIYLNFHYKYSTLTKYRTEVVFGWLDLVVAFGGIAGLFIGASILSGVELIYYFTIGFWVYMRDQIDKMKTSRANKVSAASRRILAVAPSEIFVEDY
ncbi:pickpocket protein 19-like [Hermetia illucens]|uniref:pickpocket protein 19-like n=1 Tax=Hermetia illucens TaxID=343691 RepID=UPI0018CC53A0|nr:pickpocket protein 19-like [Hermetia illucens]